MSYNLILLIVLTFASYLLGSVSSAIVLSKLMKLPDPRSAGSKNPGATNVLRLGNKKAAILTLLGDTIKGVIPVCLAQALGLDEWAVAIVALAVFLGHIFPVFFGFKGGKGVATALGCMLALSWQLGLALIITWLAVALITRYSSLAAVVTAILAPFYAYFLLAPEYVILTSIVSLILLYRHKGNICKLYLRQEDKIGRKK